MGSFHVTAGDIQLGQDREFLWLQQQNRFRGLPVVCGATRRRANTLPVINIKAVARRDLSANPIARREFRGPGRKGGLNGLFFSPRRTLSTPPSPPPSILPTFLLHYVGPGEKILHHVNVM